MKKFIVIIALFTAFSASAYEAEVEGYNEDGEYVTYEGEVDYDGTVEVLDDDGELVMEYEVED